MSRSTCPGGSGERTRALIAETLVSLLDEMAYSSVSVRLLARRAHVSRSTFYRHFDSKDDALLYYAELIYGRHFAAELSADNAPAGPADRVAFLGKQLAFVRDHAGYFRALWQNGLLDQAFERLDLTMADVQSGGAASLSPYARAVFAGASASVIKCWVERDFREDEGELVALFARLDGYVGGGGGASVSACD